MILTENLLYERDSLQREVKALRDSLDRARLEAASLREEKELLLAEVESQCETAQRIAADHLRVCEENARLRNDIAEISDKLTNTRTRVSEARRGRDQLRAEIEVLRNDLVKAEAEIAMLRGACGDKERIGDELIVKLAKAEAHVGALVQVGRDILEAWASSDGELGWHSPLIERLQVLIESPDPTALVQRERKQDAVIEAAKRVVADMETTIPIVTPSLADLVDSVEALDKP